MQDAVPVGQNMYCLYVYTQDTGSTKHIDELEVLQHQHSQHLGIFQCDFSVVFSDVSVEVGSGMTTTVRDFVNYNYFTTRQCKHEA